MSEPAVLAEPPQPTRQSRGRATAVWAALVLAGILLLLTSFAIWVNRVALNTDVFVETSNELIDDDAIRKAISTRAVDALFESVDVEAEIEEQLPADYKNLSGAATAGLRQASYNIVDRALGQPQLQRLWAASVEQSHRTLVDVLEGGGDNVTTEGGVVTLELEPIVLEAADRIGIRDQIEDRLPEDVGSIVVLESDQLDTAQDGFQLMKTIAWLLPILTVAAFAFAVWLSRDRRRAIRGTGAVLIVTGLLGLVAVNLVGNYIVESLTSETENEQAASNAWDILTQLLRLSFVWLAIAGVLFVVAAWLAGPGRRATSLRYALAPAFRERIWPYGALALLGIVLLLTSAVTDFTRILALLVILGLGVLWIEVMRRQTLHEVPAGEASFLDEMRDRIEAWWETRQQARPAAPPPGVPPTGADITAKLASLAELHSAGALTDDEYASAKARVLASE